MASQHQTHAARKPDIWPTEPASRLLGELGNEGSDSERNTQPAMGLNSQLISHPFNQKASQPDSCLSNAQASEGDKLRGHPLATNTMRSGVVQN